MEDCLIVGGGVIGLSLAYELNSRGMSVRVIERGLPGQEASWAGAGLLPPAKRSTARNALEALAGLSSEMHAEWARELLVQTGVDTGYRRSGSVHIARDEESALLLAQLGRQLREQQIEAQELEARDLAQIEPALAHPGVVNALHGALFMPDEAQLRNPRHLKALAIACALRGVSIQSEVSVESFEVNQGRVSAVRTSAGRLAAKAICLCSGAWTGEMAARLGVHLPMVPVRGQMVLLSAPAPVFGRIINEGRRYVVPRADGRVLIGSTEEEVGFDKRTTAGGIGSLLQFGCDLVPELAGLQIERTWAGLRPGTPDGMPYIGRLGELENVFVAAGHYRGGLHLAPGTARVLSQLMCGETPEIDLAPLSPQRAGREVPPTTIA